MTDAASPQQLTDRQEKILALIVQTYVRRPEPVGSKSLTEIGMNVSSATIRNEMATLEALGFISQPHTSAGRIPTESGYRYFVRRLLDETELTPAERKAIADEFEKHARDLDSGLQIAVTTLARTAPGAALVTKPQVVSAQFKHVELIATQGRTVLLVLVLHGGSVLQQMLTLAEMLPQATLSAAAGRLNLLGERLTAEQIRQKARDVDQPLDREILELVADTMADADTPPLTVAYRDGLTEMLPEFDASEGMQQAIRIMEERTLSGAIAAGAAGHLGEKLDGVSVVIGGEGQFHEARHLSLIVARYGINGKATGILGVLGPTRMRYGRAIASVRYVAGLMSGMLIDIYGVGDANPEG